MHSSDFPSPVLGLAISAVFLERLYLSLSFPKQFFVFVIVREMKPEKSQTISDGKIVRWQQDHIHNFIISTNYLIRFSFSQTIRK